MQNKRVLKKIYLAKIKEKGFSFIEIIFVVMLILIITTISLPLFNFSKNKAKQKEATGIVSALVKAATAFQTEYGDLPTDAGDIEEYARFQMCDQPKMATEGGKVCKGTDPKPVPDANKSFYSTSGNYFIEFQSEEVGGKTLFQVRAQPNGGAYKDNGSAVTGCYNPVDATSKVYEKTAKAVDRGLLKDWKDAEC